MNWACLCSSQAATFSTKEHENRLAAAWNGCGPVSNIRGGDLNYSDVLMYTFNQEPITSLHKLQKWRFLISVIPPAGRRMTHRGRSGSLNRAPEKFNVSLLSGRRIIFLCRPGPFLDNCFHVRFMFMGVIYFRIFSRLYSLGAVGLLLFFQRTLWTAFIFIAKFFWSA